MPDRCSVCHAMLQGRSRWCSSCGAPAPWFERRRLRRRRRALAARALNSLGWALLLGAVVLVWKVDVESAVAPVPLVVALGLGAAVVALQGHDWRSLWLSISQAAIGPLCGLLVLLRNWDTTQARKPFLVIGVAYLLLSLPVLILMWFRLPSRGRPWQCPKCGYLLHGLPEPRCPECGRPFEVVQAEDLDDESDDDR